MAHLERILVPVDFSDHSAVAARQAGELARRFQAEVTLFHVNEFLVFHPLTGPLGFGVTTGEAERDEHEAMRRKQLESFGEAELSGVSVNRLAGWGDPAKLIVERAQAEKSDLIVMPTRGRGTFRRLLLGSVTAKVLHDVDCPVWTGAHLAGAPTAGLMDLRHVMCGVHLREGSIPIIRWAADIACAFGAALTVAHVALDPPPSLPERYIFQWREQANWAANERLQTLLLESKTLAEVLVVNGDETPKALSGAVQEKGAGLLVIGRGGTGNADQRLGAHTYATICQAPCPVASVFEKTA